MKALNLLERGATERLTWIFPTMKKDLVEVEVVSAVAHAKDLYEIWRASNMKFLIPAIASLLVMSTAVAQAGDVAIGEKVFKRCAACHILEETGKRKQGPTLFKIIGRPAGSVEGYKYSDINKVAASAGLVWTEENIAAYLENPQKYLEDFVVASGADLPAKKRTKMAFKLKKPDHRADVAAYLASLSK